MAFKDYFPIEMLLNPKVYYDGEVYLRPSEIEACAKPKDKISSQYWDFIQKNYMNKYLVVLTAKNLSAGAKEMFCQDLQISFWKF